ncbi:hypothetical protein SAY87_031316 [Trapa incisa]|uniref:SBP-type domain-containing protein n=1 Tax=Trapa incisa TaxID=236973 RepID=A0AAN7KQX0_9MYRT|nr:hypothetical protein SAY87_031316 [Trapa incisa]
MGSRGNLEEQKQRFKLVLDEEEEEEEGEEDEDEGLESKRIRAAAGGNFAIWQEADKGFGSSSGTGGHNTAGVWVPPPRQVTCQADRCTADMTEAKKYHRRHKVCEFHAKAPVVLIDGTHQRFCQQCSKFHHLSEFDETKRSCRRRLANHNERRRKISCDNAGEGGTN